MTASVVGYERVQEWVKTMLGRTHATVVQTVAWAVLCVLLAQRVTPAALHRMNSTAYGLAPLTSKPPDRGNSRPPS